MMVNIVTSNAGKLMEFQSALGDVMELRHLPIGYVEVQTDSLEDVVRHGLDELRDRGVGNVIIDDSGLFIDALGGFPGVYSSYAYSTLGNAGVLKLLSGVGERRARFRCCIGASIDGIDDIVLCEDCPGTIPEGKMGSGGFGFDPIFVPDGSDRSFSQMDLVEKNDLSHRGRAIRSFDVALREALE